MNIIGSQFLSSYKVNPDVRKRIFEYESELESEFNLPFKAFAIPDTEDPIIPRFEADSKSGFSKIQVSQNRVTLATSYSTDFGKYPRKVQEYIENKNSHIQKLMSDEKIEFIALILQLTDHFDTEDAVNQEIKNITSGLSLTRDFVDFTLGYSYMYNNIFFINVKVSKFLEKEFRVHDGKMTDIPTGNIRYGVSVILDINSKLFLEKNGSYYDGLLNDLFQLTFGIVELNTLKNYLNGDIEYVS